MSDDRINDLIDRWEIAHDRGETLSVDDLCTDCPELRDDVDVLIKRLKSVDTFLSAEHDADTAERRAGRYDVKEALAAGGIGEIFVARDTELQRDVVVKWLQKRWLHNTENRKRFEMEAEITGRLEHPGVIPVYGFGKNLEGEPYYAMRFVRGETLEAAIFRFHETVARDGSEFQTAEFQKLLRTFLAVCQTIAYAHSRKVVHRDIKPANIMLGAYGETLVVDWGLAKPLDGDTDDESPPPPDRLDPLAAQSIQHTIDGSAKGSPAYMSPEQARGDARGIREASDVYSLGATLYLLMTGNRPISGTNIVEYLEAVKEGQFKPPREVRDNVPKPLEAVCLKAMRKEPAERYTSAGELADDIERFLADEPVVAWTEPWTLRTRRWIRRHRVAVTSSVVALVMAVAALGILSYQERVANGLLSDANGKLNDANTELNTANTSLNSANANLRTSNRKLNVSIVKERSATIRANSNAQLAAAEARKAKQEKAAADKLREAAEQDAYASRIALAHREYLAGRLEHSLATLLECPEQRRGWEWHYLHRLHHLHHSRIEMETAQPAAVAIRSDGQQAAVAYGGAALRAGWVDVFNLATGKRLYHVGPSPMKLLARIGHHESSLGWSDDGLLVVGDVWSKGILSGTRTGFVEIWSTVGAKPRLVWSEKRDLKIDGRLVVSPGARYFAWTHENGEIEIQKVKSPRTKGAVFTGFVKQRRLASRFRGQVPYLNESRMAFTNSGDLLAVGRGDDLYLIDAATGKSRAHKKLNSAASVQRIAVDPKGDRVVVALYDRSIRLWDAGKNAEPLHVVQLREDVNHLAFSPTGGSFAAADALGIVRRWAVANPRGGAAPAKLITATPSHSGGVDLVRFHPKSARLLTVGIARGIDRNGVGASHTELKTWPTDIPELDRRRWTYVKAVAYSRDGRYRVRLSSRNLTIADAGTDEKKSEVRFKTALKFRTITVAGKKRTVIDSSEADATDLRFTPDGRTLAIWGSGWVRFYDWNDAKPTLKKKVDLGKGPSRYSAKTMIARSISQFAFEPDGAHALVYLYPDVHEVCRMQVETGNIVNTWKTDLRLNSVRFDVASGRAVLSGRNPKTKQNEIWFHDLKTDKPLAGKTLAGYSMSDSSADGTLIAAKAPKKKNDFYRLEIRSVASGKLLWTIRSPTYSVRCRFHPQGNRIAVWDDKSSRVRLHDARTGRELIILDPAEQLTLHKKIEDVRFSGPLGRRMTVRTFTYLYELNASPASAL